MPIQGGTDNWNVPLIGADRSTKNAFSVSSWPFGRTVDNPLRDYNMGLWAKNATEFVVSVSFITGAGSSYGCVPKPVLAKLGNPKRIRYAIHDDQVIINNADSQ